jgi:hypothetical protein
LLAAYSTNVFLYLYQVFIRTVNKYAEGPRQKTAGSATVIGGSARMSIEGTALIDAEHVDHNDASILDGLVLDEVVQELNKCGCTNMAICYVVLGLLVLTVALIGIAIGVSTTDASASGLIWIFAFLSLIAMIVFCFIRYCAFCQHPKGADE